MNPSTTTIGTTVKPQLVWRTRGIGYWTRRIVLGLLVALVALGATGAIYQVVATALARRAYPPPGQLVAVSDMSLHIFCTGESKPGSPTVILEAGIAGTSADWSWVQPAIATHTRTCSYDRAGMGWSSASRQPRDAGQIAAELHTLLTKAGVAGPYVLVGHSFGGLYVRKYVADYPKDVAGLVLVEATHPDLWKRLPPSLGTPPDQQPLGLFPIIARLGLARLGLIDVFPVDPDLAPQQRAAIGALNTSTTSMETISAELRAFPATAAQVHDASALGNLPLAVLSAGNDYAIEPPDVGVPARQTWAKLQAELAALSQNTTHRTIPEATHESLVHKQADAEPTIAVILQVVEAARTGQPLAR